MRSIIILVLPAICYGRKIAGRKEKELKGTIRGVKWEQKVGRGDIRKTGRG